MWAMFYLALDFGFVCFYSKILVSNKSVFVSIIKNTSDSLIGDGVVVVVVMLFNGV